MSSATPELADLGGPSVADHIAALLEHPDTPADIYNAVAEVVTDLTARHQLAREVLRVSLPLALDKSQPAVADHAVADEDTQAADVQPSACSCRGKGVGDADSYAGITLERAKELADFITNYDDNEQCHALIMLLEGVAHALYHGDRQDVEGLIINAQRAAYTNAPHCNDAFHRFVELSEDDLRPVSERLRQE